MDWNSRVQGPSNMMGGYNQNWPYQTAMAGMNNIWNNTAPSMGQPTNSSQQLPCRMVSSENDIQANEIPVNGTYVIFVKNDLKEVYIRVLGSDGVIHGSTFELKSTDNLGRVDQNGNIQPDPFKEITDRLDYLTQYLTDANVKAGSSNVNKKTTAKEAKTNAES